MMAFLRRPFPDRRTVLLIAGAVAPCVGLLCLGIWIIHQERELAEKRVVDDRARMASFAGQELSARLETAVLRAVSGRVTPADGEIALIGSLESGVVRFPWQPVETHGLTQADLADAGEAMYRDPENAVGRLRQVWKQSTSVNSRAKALLLMAIALRRAGRIGEAAGAERDLRLLPVSVADEYGVPYFLYAAKQTATSPEAAPSLLRDLDAALRNAWLPPMAVFMIADIARQVGPAGVSVEQRALMRARELERAIALLSGISAGTSVPWRISTDPEAPLMAAISEPKKLMAVFRARSVLNSIPLPSGAEWVIGSGRRGLAVHDSMPQLKIQFASTPAIGGSFPRQLLYS